MASRSPSNTYVRIVGDRHIDSNEVWGITQKCASTSLNEWLPQPRQYTELRTGDYVRIIVRDPRDRMLSAWRWFTGPHNSVMRDILTESPRDHAILLDRDTPLNHWVPTALRHWNLHWLPQTEVHPRWREFHLIPIHDLAGLGMGHSKKTRPDNSWEEFYDVGTLALVNAVYAEDLDMWKEIKDGTDKSTNRLL